MGFWKNLFFGKKSGSGLVLALDIGTEFVKALVVKMDKSRQKGIVLGFGKVRQKLGNMSAGAVSDINGVVVTCAEAIGQAEEMAGVKDVCQTVMGIAGELVKGATTTVHYERANPEIRIDLPELKNIVQKVQWKAFDRIRKQLSWETGQGEVDVKLINATIVRVKIDGYRINNPLGFQGRDVSISIFNAYAPMVHLGAMQKIADELSLELLSIVAEPYAVAKSMAIYNNPDFGAIIIDIGGGTTDIALVRSGGLEGTVMYALGGRAFTKRISTFFGITFEEAEKLKIEYSFGRLDEETSKQIKEVIKEDCEIWASGLEIALQNFLNYDLLPPRILLCGGGSALPEIKETLLNGEIWKDLPIGQPIKVSYLQPQDVVNITDETGLLDSPQVVTPMGLANMALDITSEEKMLSGVLDKAVKIIQN